MFVGTWKDLFGFVMMIPFYDYEGRLEGWAEVG
jgi:hypothetical protein